MMAKFAYVLLKKNFPEMTDSTAAKRSLSALVFTT